jgi:general secretion pathway protein G
MTDHWAEVRRIRRSGMTLLEIMIIVMIIGTLVALSIPFYKTYLNHSRIVRATADIRAIENELTLHSLSEGDVPDSLNVLRRIPTDPWKREYVYLKYSTELTTVKFRKERFYVPLNLEYDLYSLGADGLSEPPLSAPVSRDDIIRANDGEYVGIATGF